MNDQPPNSSDQAMWQCSECTILIGEGYQETRPFIAPDGRSVVCFRCYESLLRQATRRSE